MREVEPQTSYEAESLRTALEYTRNSFFHQLQQDAPATNLEASYHAQLDVIVKEFDRLWQEKYPELPRPSLFSLGQWQGEIYDWPRPPWIEEMRFDWPKHGPEWTQEDLRVVREARKQVESPGVALKGKKDPMWYRSLRIEKTKR